MCSTLRWISLFHLCAGLTGEWIILTGPVWGLSDSSPWLCVFSPQHREAVSRCRFLFFLFATLKKPTSLFGFLAPDWLASQGWGRIMFSATERWGFIGSRSSSVQITLCRRLCLPVSALGASVAMAHSPGLLQYSTRLPRSRAPLYWWQIGYCKRFINRYMSTLQLQLQNDAACMTPIFLMEFLLVFLPCGCNALTCFA